MGVRGVRMAVSKIYMDEWNENSSARKTEKITGFVISELRPKIRLVMSNVRDSQDNILEEIHECDILYITSNDYAVEYEVKVSKSDLLADAKKQHNHDHKLIRQTYFVVPTDLVGYAQKHLPEEFGIIEYVIGSRKRLFQVRKAKFKKATKWSEKQKMEIYKKGYQRYLTIKEDLA